MTKEPHMRKPVRITNEGIYIGKQLIAASDMTDGGIFVTPIGGDLFEVGVTLLASMVTFGDDPGRGMKAEATVPRVTVHSAPGLSDSDVARIAAARVAWEIR